MWTLVERKTVTGSAVTSVTFNTGINGDSDFRHMLVWRISAGVAGNHWAYIQVNGNTSTSAYEQTYHYAKGGYSPGASNQSSLPGMVMVNQLGSAGAILVGKLDVFAKTGAKRAYIGGGNIEDATTPPYETTVSGLYAETSTNITSYTFTHDTTGGIGVGSYFEVWKLGPPPPVAMGEWSLVERRTFTSAATNCTFSGLNGDADRRYLLKGFVVNGYSGGASELAVFLNGETAANVANYSNNTLYTNSSSVYGEINSSGRVDFISCGGAGTIGFGEAEISGGSGTYKFIATKYVSNTTSTTVYNTIIRNGLWKSNAAITSISAIGSQTNAIGVGSYIELWKLSS